MKLSEHKDLKTEILALPPKEKDKLLLRLVAKDKVLTEHLHFLLLEDESHLRDRVEAIKDQILQTMQSLMLNKSLNAKEVLTNLRKLAKQVNHNFRVTKAAFEDVDLRIFLFNQTPIEFKSNIFSSHKSYEQIFATYFVKSTQVTLRKFYKLHPDLQFDLQADMIELLNKIHKGKTKDIASDLGLSQQI